MRIKRSLVLMAILAVALPVWAQEETTPSSSGSSGGSDIGYRGWGFRAGVASDPDQVLGGVQFNFGNFARNLRFQPDLQAGFGDDATTIFATLPVHYRFRDTGQDFTPYAGGGLALGWIDVDLPAGSSGDDSEFEVGGRLTGGLEWGRSNGGAFAIELSLGIGDVHDFTAVAIWNFGK